GSVRIAEVNIGEILKAAVQKGLKQVELEATIAAKNIGYELRCADPITMDMEYTRDLGYCAAKYGLGGGNAAVISLQAGRFVPIPFAAMIDPVTGRARTRRVDITSTRYAIARRYMIRLRRDDFEDPHELAGFAATAHVSVEEVRRQFAHLLEEEPPPVARDGVAALGARGQVRRPPPHRARDDRLRVPWRADDPNDQPRHRAGGGDARHADRPARVSADRADRARRGTGAAGERAGRGRVWQYGGV